LLTPLASINCWINALCGGQFILPPCVGSARACISDVKTACGGSAVAYINDVKMLS